MSQLKSSLSGNGGTERPKTWQLIDYVEAVAKNDGIMFKNTHSLAGFPSGDIPQTKEFYGQAVAALCRDVRPKGDRSDDRHRK